jgi:hypothetical protein
MWFISDLQKRKIYSINTITIYGNKKSVLSNGKKTLLGIVALCATNFHPLQAHAASQLSIFHAVGPTPPHPSLLLIHLPNLPHAYVTQFFYKQKTFAHRYSSWSSTLPC